MVIEWSGDVQSGKRFCCLLGLRAGRDRNLEIEGGGDGMWCCSKLSVLGLGGWLQLLGGLAKVG